MKTNRKCDLLLRQKGFTLIEILMAMAIGTIVLGSIYMATLEGHRASTGIEQKISVQEDVRAAVDVMAMEISMASYNPTVTSNNIWSAANCGGTGSGNAAYRGIQTAGNYANSITVEMDTNGNGAIGDPNEIVTYTFDNVSKQITRSVNCGAAQAFIGDADTASNVQRNVRVINDTLGLNVFTYYDSTGADITATLPAGIPNIRRIDITLAVVATVPDVQGQTRQMIHSTSVIPRNHAIQFN